MLQKLARQDYPKTRPIFKALQNQTVIGSVIDGNTGGDIYVNDSANSTWAVVWDKMDAILVEGEIAENSMASLKHLITMVFQPEAFRKGVSGLNLYYPDEIWDKAIECGFGDLAPVKESRFRYELAKLDRHWESLVPEDCRLEPIDARLLNQRDLKNLDQVAGWIQSFWPSNAAFIDRGLGCCVVRDKTILSWCLAVFVSGREVELGLETVKDYRGQGYAKAAAAACVEHCLKGERTPLWNCEAENKASFHVAEAVGFQRTQEYQVWHLALD